ncbi:MAG TPA: hypothetical protein VI386_20105 [Candidatus Sulfotelmatobacter sp.]
MSELTSSQALQIAADFALASECMKQAGPGIASRTRICELATRIALLRAPVLAKAEFARPFFGESLGQSMFASA